MFLCIPKSPPTIALPKPPNSVHLDSRPPLEFFLHHLSWSSHDKNQALLHDMPSYNPSRLNKNITKVPRSTSLMLVTPNECYKLFRKQQKNIGDPNLGKTIDFPLQRLHEVSSGRRWNSLSCHWTPNFLVKHVDRTFWQTRVVCAILLKML